ncbi:MAG: AIR carboxylase family protein, partial [Rhizobiales bacterium]|nr:AIR carboxylase family protein [Hyphomicrobiales bacterium]
MADKTAPVAIIMGSQSDWQTMRHAAETLDALGVAHDDRIVSAHRTPDRLVILPKHLYEGTDLQANEWNRKPIGTGPYKFVSWDQGVITEEANPDWWGGKPKIQRLVFQTITDPNTRNNALKTGEVDYVSLQDLSPEGATTFAGDPQISLEAHRVDPTLTMLMFNFRNPILAKPDVRKALFMALDRKAMADVYGFDSQPGKS